MEEKHETNKKPPVDIEQWVDLIIASAAHRSHNEGQRKFGELLIQRYFIDIPKDYTNDPIAKRYIDNMLCAVASAIRGFSIARDLFETQWSTILEAKARECARAERLDAFSPFKQDGYWKQIVLIIGGLGILSPILASFNNVIGNLPWQIVLLIALSCIVLLVLMELFVDILRNSRIARVEKKYPDDLLSDWSEKTLGRYRTVCQQFLLLAIKIREEYYPELSTYHGSKIYDRYAIPHFDFDGNLGTVTDLYELNQLLSSVVEQHFAFKVKPKTISDDNKTQT